jgi:hypothetical protein
MVRGRAKPFSSSTTPLDSREDPGSSTPNSRLQNCKRRFVAASARSITSARVSKWAASHRKHSGERHAHIARQTSAMTITANIKFIDELLSSPEASILNHPA